MFKRSSILITAIFLVIAMSAFPIFAATNSNALDQRLNTVEISETTKSESEGFKRNRVVFTLNSPSSFDAEKVAVELLLPEAWSLRPSVPEKEGEITHLPFYAAADIYSGDEYVGYIGLCAFEPSYAENDDPTAIYNQIAIGNSVVWDTGHYYSQVSEDAKSRNAVTKVMYSPNLFEDKKERDNTGILAYDKNICKYIGIEIADGTTNRTVISEAEVTIIAKSVALSRPRPAISIYNETIGILIKRILGLNTEHDERPGTISISDKSESDKSEDAFLKLAEEYTSERIHEVERQQEYWHQHSGDFLVPEIISARVESFDHVLSYKGYQVYKYNGSFSSDDPERIICADEWTIGDDGWYTDLRPQYMIFKDGDSPALAGVMLCEFTPTGNSEAFFADLDKWIAEYETAERG